MSFNEFDMSEIENSKKKYAKEAKDKWGSTDVYKEFEKKSEGYNMDKWQDIDEAGKIILKKFGENRNIEPDSEIAQNLVLEWKNYISKNFYECNVGMLSCLGLMYIDDERFKENIDKNGGGTAQFIADAIECYCLENN